MSVGNETELLLSDATTEEVSDGNISTQSPETLNLTKTLEVKLKECEENVLLHDEHDSEGYCEAIWDKIYCWPKAKAGQLVSVPCPEYITGFNPNENATKYCTADGWFISPKTGQPWSNYSLCPSNPGGIGYGTHELIAEWLPIIKKISQVGYGVSFFTLLIAFFILVSIKKLRCPRNTLHMHLFVSFMLRAFMALLRDSIFIQGLPQSIVDGISVADESNWECKLVTCLWQYFIVANYTWILMEGLYLHNLIFLAPFSDSSAITLYVILGWGLPMPVVGSWIASRIFLDDTLCWTTHHNHADLFLIIRIPIIVSIVLNFLFFMNITRVLLMKLQSAVSIESRKYRYRKWAKSTMVLVPLFGVHYMMFIGMSYYMGRNPVIEIIWLFCDQLFACFQGFFVAILYCLLNGEVRSELGKKWSAWRTDTDSKNLWVPLNHITSKFYRRSTHDEMINGLSATSMAGNINTCTRHPLVSSTNCRSKTIDQELTEEHHIEIETHDH